MTELELSDPTDSEDEVEIRNLLIGGSKVGQVKAYRATEEEAKTMRSKLKKSVKPGQVFSVKVFLDREIDEESTLAVAEKIREVYKDLPGKVYFVVKTGDGIVPLRMG
jgi:hypothetical protein